MHRWPRTAFTKRTATLGLTLVLHALLLLMLLPVRSALPPSPPRALEGLWIHLLPLADLPADVEVALSTERSDEASAGAARPDARPASPVAPVPPEAADPDAGTTGTGDTGSGPRVDWHAQAAALVARAGSEVPRTSVGPPRERARQPCTPRKRSFEFSPEEEDYGLLPLPYVRAGNCVFGLGYFTCSFGGDRPNAGMFDDMQQGLTPDSSVPNPEVCD